MFGKLIKWEFKTTWRQMILMLILPIAMMLPLLAFYASANIRGICSSVFDTYFGGMYLAVYSLSLFVVAIVSIYFLMRSFYKKLFSSEGYMTFTLPVSNMQILFSKLLVGWIWMLLILLVEICSFAVIMGAMDTQIGWFFEEIGKAIISEFQTSAGFIITIILGLVSPAILLLNLYCCISLGQLMKSHPIAGSVIAFIVLRIAGQSLTSWISTLIMTYTRVGDRIADALYGLGRLNPLFAFASAASTTMNAMSVYYLIEYALYALIYILLIRWILNRHLDPA